MAHRTAPPCFYRLGTSEGNWTGSLLWEGKMPTYEVRGPDRAMNYWVVAIEMKGAVITETPLEESYPTKAEAQTAADMMNSR